MLSWLIFVDSSLVTNCYLFYAIKIKGKFCRSSKSLIIISFVITMVSFVNSGHGVEQIFQVFS